MAGDTLARHAWSTSAPESEVTQCDCSSEARPPTTRSSVRTVANECPTEPTSARCADTTYVPVTAFRVQQWRSRTTSGDAGHTPWRRTRLGRTACRGAQPQSSTRTAVSLAVFQTPDALLHGHAAVRRALERFVALAPNMTGDIQKVIEAGDTALVINRWQLDGTAPDGNPVRLAGLSADVMRRQPDGSWRVLIDDPWGGGGA